MRMWMVPTRFMCRKHLLGEHVEHHMFIGHLKQKKAVDGYIQNNCFEPKSLYSRHDLLVQEMLKRGYNHNSPINIMELDILYLPIEYQNTRVDRLTSLRDLLSRCSECYKLYKGVD